MLRPLEFYRDVLNQGVRVSDDVITLCNGHARIFDQVGKNNHCYLVLRGANNRMEVVRYDHTDDYAERTRPDTVAVQRDVLNTGRKAFGAGDCITHEWYGQYIIEWVNQEAPV